MTEILSTPEQLQLSEPDIMRIIVRIAQVYKRTEKEAGKAWDKALDEEAGETRAEVRLEARRIVKSAQGDLSPEEIDAMIKRANEVIKSSGGLDNFLDEQIQLSEEDAASQAASQAAAYMKYLEKVHSDSLKESMGRRALKRVFGWG